MKCRYSHCLHDSKDIPDGEEVKAGKLYFHADCYHVRQTIEEIKQAYLELVDPTPVMSQLVKIINKIIFEQNVDVDFLLYALKHNYARIKHPPGLYYLVKDSKVQDEWKRIKQPKIERNQFKVEMDYTPIVTEPVTAPQQTGFSQILRRQR